MRFWTRLWLAGAALVVLLMAACVSSTSNVPSLATTEHSTVSQSLLTATFTPAPMSSEATSTPFPTSTSTNVPTPTVTNSPSPTPTPTSTPTSTPTPLPAARLRLGRVFHEQGNYTVAIEQFQALLADPATVPNEAAEARYYLGQCFWLNDDPTAARTAFQDFLDACPDDPRRPAAHFQLAQVYARLEEWEAAIENYEAYLAERSVIASTVYERIGDAYAQLGDEQALTNYQAALESAPYLDRAFALREKIAEIHTRNQNYDLAVAQYNKILESAQLDTYRAQIEYLLGQTFFLAGDANAAYRHWGRAVDLYPTSHHAYLSLVELVNAGVTVDEFQRGMVDLNAGVYGPAIQAFYRYLESDAIESRDKARYYAGRAYHLSGNYDLAIDEYETVIVAYPDSPVAADAWLEKARSLAAQGRTDEAQETLEAFVKAHSDSELAPEALWRAAQLHEDAAAWARAATVYRRLQQTYPASEHAAEALFRAGLDHFRQANYQAAVEDWQKLITHYADSDRLSAVRYWLGKTYSALGDEAQADQWLASAARSASFFPDYYALRAAHRLEASTAGPDASTSGDVERWPIVQPNLLLHSKEATARAEAEAWLLTWADPAGEMDDLATLAEALAQDPRYQRGVEYLSVGLDHEAVDEFEIMRMAQRDEPLLMYGLALATRELGVYKTSIRCALRVAGLSPAHAIDGTPSFLQQLAYPVYFDDLVLAEAAANNVDPLLIFALIRQESLFEPGVRSYARAIGLMQIIPSTGEWIALQLGWQDFVPAHLTRPHLNVHFGTWFLTQELNTFQGNVFAALAAYNSGIAAPSRWLDVAGDDPDLFVETIDYSQTLHYVQLIYQHHAFYRRIYQ